MTTRPSGPSDPAGADVPGTTERSWSPPLWRVALYTLAGACGLLVAAIEDLAWRVGSLDAAGRLMVGVLAAGIWALAIRDLLARPTVRVSPAGLDIVDGLRRRHLPWAAVVRARAGTLTHNRRAVHQRMLEVETIDGSILVSRRQLGTDPDRVAETIEEIRLRLD